MVSQFKDSLRSNCNCRNVDALEDDVIYPYSKNTQVWYQMILDKMVSVWDGKRPMEEVCLEVADEMNAYLAEE